jgi:hypothetical protein
MYDGQVRTSGGIVRTYNGAVRTSPPLTCMDNQDRREERAFA